MANIELLILISLAVGIFSYVVGLFNAKVGSYFTILGSLFIFGSIAYYGFHLNELEYVSEFVPSITYSFSELGLFFGLIVSFTFAMVSFFNPFFVEKYKFLRVYSLLYMFALAGSIGVFFTDDLRMLFFFFELVVWTSLFLIPMGRSRKAASLYFGFSAFGSFSLLFGILLIGRVTGGYEVTNIASMSGGYSITVFITFLIAAFSKLGAFPFHIWLPKVLQDSPAPVSALFSGGLEKLGAFVAVLGLVKLMPVGTMINLNGYINMTSMNYVVAFLGGLTIIFGTFMAIRQDDAKKLLAYSSMSNGGYILVAFAMMNSMSVSGGFYHVLAHALASTAAFLAIAAVEYYTGTTKMKELGGMIHKMPITYMVYLIAIISMAGIPPMGGFISKWMIFQSVIDNGMILVGIATFIGSIGSFLYVFRPLAALFLGQELPQHRDHTKEAPLLMLIPMLIYSGLNVYTGVVPNYLLGRINNILVELGLNEVILLDGLRIQGENGVLNPAYISIVFGFGVFVAFIIFILLKKSKKVGLMDTYTAGNFVYTEELLHYSLDFYAPLERLYEKYINIMKNFYRALANKVREFGAFVKYFFFTNKPEVTVFFVMVILVLLLWGDVL